MGRFTGRAAGLGYAAGDLIGYAIDPNWSGPQMVIVSMGSGDPVTWNTGGDAHIVLPALTVLEPTPQNGYRYTLGTDGFLTPVQYSGSPAPSNAPVAPPAPAGLVAVAPPAPTVTVQTVVPSASSPATSGSPIVAGQTFHFEGYGIQVQMVGTGGTGGLLTDEGVSLPMGTQYIITSGAGAGEVWQTTGPNSAIQITAAGGAPAELPGAGSVAPAAAVAAPSILDSLSGDVGGFPVWILLAGGVGLLFLMGRKN